MNAGASLLPAGLADFAHGARGPLCLVRVHGARGSVPRGTDAALLVGPEGHAGTIGGGHLEFEAIRCARELLRSGRLPASLKDARPARAPAEEGVEIRRFALGPSLGQCCGGSVDLAFAMLRDPAAQLPMLRSLEPRPHQLWLYGAGHVAQALVHVMLTLPFTIRWIDTREDVFHAGLPVFVETVLSEDPAREAALAPPGVFHLVMTHSHAIDFDVVHALLARSDAAFCGLIGSATKRVTFENRLRARGMAEDRIENLVCPIGIPQLQGKLPGTIAVAVAAQLLEYVQVQAQQIGEVKL